MPVAKIYLNLKEVQQEIHDRANTILDSVNKINREPLTESQYGHTHFIRQAAETLRLFTEQLSSSKPIANAYGKGPCVLLVEDNELLQLIHREMLTNLGCKVDIAATGEAALKMAEQGYDFILMDVGLPGKSGIEVTVELRAREEQQRLRIIALTAHGEGIEAACLAAGMEQVLHKPVNLETLKELIHSKRQ